MQEKNVKLPTNKISITSSGRVVLSDDKLAALEAEFVPTAASGTNTGNCLNYNCDGSSNELQCRNVTSCAGADNQTVCKGKLVQ